jgi:hypothetical protein
MSFRKEEAELVQLLGLCRIELKEHGIALDRTRKSVIDGIVAVFGNAHLEPVPLMRLYLRSMEDRKVPQARLVLNRPYKPDRAMRIAAERSASHPKMIGIN